MEITISLPKNVETALLKKAEETGKDLRTVVEHIIEISVEPDLRVAPGSDLETDMLAFAEGTENRPAYNGDYSRSELYSDHD